MHIVISSLHISDSYIQEDDGEREEYDGGEFFHEGLVKLVKLVVLMRLVK